MTAPRVTVAVRHNFETAHRLPVLGGKCQNLHGHSWWAEWEIAGVPSDVGTVAEFGDLKRVLRSWVDAYLDHGAILGAGDPLVQPLLDEGCRVFRFGATPAQTDPVIYHQGRPALPDAEDLVTDWEWPTVEATAVLLARVASLYLPEVGGEGLEVVRVTVRETAVNEATVTYP